MNQADFISLEGAARALNVNRTTMYYYLEQFGVVPEKFPLDRRRYIAITDLNRIKEAKKAAAARANQEELTT